MLVSDSLVGVSGGGDLLEGGRRGGESRGGSRAGDSLGRAHSRQRKRGREPKFRGTLADSRKVYWFLSGVYGFAALCGCLNSNSKVVARFN